MHGLDDLRQIVFNTRRKLNVWADGPTSETLLSRFGYAFEAPPGSPYPPILRLKTIEAEHFDPTTPITVLGEGGPIEATPFTAMHGRAPALGFRIGGLAYLPDANEMPEEAWGALEGLDVFIVDALRYTAHPTHANVETALEWIARARPKQAVLTNMHVDLDYETIAKETPEHVVPAFDGMAIELPVR
jgi:phosphoribosyl 1,2-cyclic phosphate phosphodiesterase